MPLDEMDPFSVAVVAVTLVAPEAVTDGIVPVAVETVIVLVGGLGSLTPRLSTAVRDAT